MQNITLSNACIIQTSLRSSLLCLLINRLINAEACRICAAVAAGVQRRQTGEYVRVSDRHVHSASQ